MRFAPCARSHWHSHRLGQTLHILDGTALLGSRDGTVIEAHPGDTISTAPGEEHWHGAAPDRFMAHLVLMEGDDSDAPQTSWGGPVTDADYTAPRCSAAATAASSRRSPATRSAPLPGRSTGTAPRPAASWPTWP